MKWPYNRAIDPAHAWGVVAVGTAGLVAIPTILATLHATDPHFRWWWPTNWMAIPAAIFLIGMGLAAFPVRRPVSAARMAGEVGTVVTSSISGTGDNDEPGKSALSREPLPVLAEPTGHAFISYVREDARHVDQLQRDLEAAGISVWRDTANLWPGEDWRMKIRRAISDDALVFIACFSTRSIARAKSHQNEEVMLAIDQLRLRRPDVPWLIPVRFDECQMPEFDIGGGRTISSLQRADLFGENRDAVVMRLLATVLRLLEQNHSEQEPSGNSDKLDNEPVVLDRISESKPTATDILSERFRAQWADDLSLFNRLRQQPSFEDVSAALRRSSELHIISKHGIRAPLEHTSIYVRIPHPDEWPADSVIPLHLEERWMETISTHEWRLGQSFVDTFFSIAADLRSTGHWEGEQNYSPDATFEQFADLLIYGIEAMRKGFDGVVNRIFQIVRNDWVITEWELIDKANQYQIVFRRLNEIDWISHVTNKEWVDRSNFLEAFGFSEMLVYNGIFRGNLPPGWKLPTVWPFKTVLDGASLEL